MNKPISETTKLNVTKAVGAASYEEVVNADENKMKQYVAAAKKRAKIKIRTKPTVFSAGNPYVMLQRKINNKGKRVL